MKEAVFVMAYGSDRFGSYGSAGKIHAERIEKITGIKTYYGFASQQEPRWEDTMKQMIQDGVDTVYAIPFFISADRYASTFVARFLGFDKEQRKGICSKWGNVNIIETGGFTDHPGMDKVMAEIAEHYEAVPGKTGIVLISHGARDCAGTPLAESAADYLRKRGFMVICGYNEHQHPDDIESVEQATGTEGIENILVIPFFVSPSSHTCEDIVETLKLDSDRKRMYPFNGKMYPLTYTYEVGMSPSVAEILAERVIEAKGH